MLTDAQQQVLAAALRASTDPVVVAALAIRNDMALADWCNALSAFIVWRSRVSQDEIMQNGFDWTQVDNLTVGKARIWEWMFDNSQGEINPSKSNIRGGIDECWKGTAAMLAVRAAVYVHCKRAATNLEEIFATGTGTDATPGLLVVDGNIGHPDVSQALNRF
jgi:hypothetical protein